MKIISSRKLSETLDLTECRDGFWLYDKTRGMNLAMRASTSEDAFLEALGYYQRRLATVESNYTQLRASVGHFFSTVAAFDSRLVPDVSGDDD